MAMHSASAVVRPTQEQPGSSIAAIKEVASSLGYAVVHVNGINAVLIRRDILATAQAAFVGADDLQALCSRPRTAFSEHNEWTEQSSGRCGIVRTQDGAHERLKEREAFWLGSNRCRPARMQHCFSSIDCPILQVGPGPKPSRCPGRAMS
eukprot:TRINITY_DN29897_c0_g1_i2.p1 TRINITY_DN29897_c0_g1~~TRINITY_DN29897_c0_g1_i2.p1  ORF type:complete len:150 (+),score=10.39 TRINITY_DN29897_c0_g1_i2:318-767(+)